MLSSGVKTICMHHSRNYAEHTKQVLEYHNITYNKFGVWNQQYRRNITVRILQKWNTNHRNLAWNWFLNRDNSHWCFNNNCFLRFCVLRKENFSICDQITHLYYIIFAHTPHVRIRYYRISMNLFGILYYRNLFSHCPFFLSRFRNVTTFFLSEKQRNTGENQWIP